MPLSPQSTDPNILEEKSTQRGPDEASIETACIPDVAAEDDGLEFKTYVDAVFKFLTDANTKAPLTMSIEGEWGCGKSSFMKQLAKLLRGTTPRDGMEAQRELVVNFNAWRHDKEDALWAAFALAFIEQIDRDTTFFRRWGSRIRLFIKRFDLHSGWIDAARAIMVSALLVSVMIAVPILYFQRGSEYVNNELLMARHSASERDSNANDRDPAFPNWVALPVRGGGWMGALALSAFICLQAVKLLGNPLQIKLERFVNSPDYRGRTAFIENFHRDFKKIVDAYAGKRKVFVFIDDLDRCEAPKAAELMGAINLLISDETPLIFVIGMDRKKVAAGIAIKYETLLPYFDKAQSNGSVKNLQLGYSFLEKFVQLPFSVPSPSPKAIKGFLGDLSRPQEPAGRVPRWSLISTFPFYKWNPPTPRQQPKADSQVDSATQARRAAYILNFSGDSAVIREIAEMIAPALDNNPRRLKQFINLFRLRLYLASETGLLDLVDGNRQVTPQQLGKITAISLKWPDFVSDWAGEQSLLSDVQGCSIDEQYFVRRNGPSETASRWTKIPALISLLRYRCVDDEKDAADIATYGLSELTVQSLFHVAPRRIVTKRTTAAPSTESASQSRDFDVGDDVQFRDAAKVTLSPPKRSAPSRRRESRPGKKKK